MTSYPQTYFDKTTGTLEQLVRATVTQSLVNKDYVLSIIKDFTTDSIKWNVTTDAIASDNPTATLELDLTFATLPYDRNILTDTPSFDMRIASMNALSVNSLSLPQNIAYPLKSFPAQLPAYLDGNTIQNTLERRLMALVLHARNVQNWIARWNYWASEWFITSNALNVNGYRPRFLPTIAEIEIVRDAMIDELTTGIIYQPVPAERDQSVYAVAVSNPGNARAEIDLLNGNDSVDPASVQSPLSNELRDQLLQQTDNFADNRSDSVPQAATPTQSPTLPDC